MTKIEESIVKIIIDRIYNNKLSFKQQKIQPQQNIISSEHELELNCCGSTNFTRTSTNVSYLKATKNNNKITTTTHSSTIPLTTYTSNQKGVTYV